MKLQKVVGQRDIIKNLLRSVDEQRVSHAQIFAGPQGSGKLALAIAFAQYISCENKADGDSCGKCASCQKYEKLIHPDLHFVFPVIKKSSSTDPVSDHFIDEWRKLILESPYFNLNHWLKCIGVKNEQGLIYASEAGEIIKKLSLKTYESDYKIMIIWLPELMHRSAANKLLKMIEEPPDNTLFFLVTENPDTILPTILSRCQFLRIPAISESDLKDELISNYELDEKKADSVSHLAKGNYLRAIELLVSDDIRNKKLDNFIKLMRFAYRRDIISLTEWSEDMAATGREAQKSFLVFGLGQIRENFIMNINEGNDRIVYLEGAEEEFAVKFHKFIHHGNIDGLSDEFTKAHSHISANGNPRIIFLDLALRVSGLIRQ